MKHESNSTLLDDGAILRLDQVCEYTGLSRAVIYRRVADGKFPKPRRVSNRAIGWRVSDLRIWSRGLDTVK
ncbi:AlpA family phage regulatory protein [Methylolobus aquaticus]|nr:AlpA family phage regulatory protein [Methylolobus aquaticus]